MQTKEKNNLIIIRLFKDENIIEKLKKACKDHKIENAILLSAIGQFKKVKLGYFKEKGNYYPNEFDYPLEILNITGNICKLNNDFTMHLHATLSDEDKNSIGGHLIDGIISVTAEIAILKTELKFSRKENNDTGLLDLNLK